MLSILLLQQDECKLSSIKSSTFIPNLLTKKPVHKTFLIIFRFPYMCRAFHILLLRIVFIMKTTNNDFWIPPSTLMSFNTLTLKLVDVLLSSLSSSGILVTAAKVHDLPILCKSEICSGLASAKTKISPGNVLYGSLLRSLNRFLQLSTLRSYNFFPYGLDSSNVITSAKGALDIMSILETIVHEFLPIKGKHVNENTGQLIQRSVESFQPIKNENKGLIQKRLTKKFHGGL